MDPIYQTVHFRGSEHLKLFAHKMMNRIFKMTPTILQAEVTLSEGESGNLQNQFCEIKLDVPGKNIFVKKNAATYEQAIRVAVNAARKIVRRRKE